MADRRKASPRSFVLCKMFRDIHVRKMNFKPIPQRATTGALPVQETVTDSEVSARGAQLEVEENELMPAETSLTAVSKDVEFSDEPEKDKTPSSMVNRPAAAPSTCPAKHEGKMVVRETYSSISVDNLFTLLFTHNKFTKNLTDTLKYTDVNVTEWEENPATGLKTRVCTCIVPVTQPIGPKTCNVRESQVVLGCSKPGELYAVEGETVNSGVPYCDSFYIISHYCITSDTNGDTVLTVYYVIKYRKSVWSLVKNFIEKNVWVGLDEYYNALMNALEEHCSNNPSNVLTSESRVQKRESTKVSTSSVPPAKILPVEVSRTLPLPYSYSTNDFALWTILAVLFILVIFNAILFFKLSALQDVDKEYRFTSVLDSRLLYEQRTHDQWVSLLQRQAFHYQKEIQGWKTTLQSVIALLKQAEESITTLQSHIMAAGSDKISETVTSLLEPDNATHNKVHTELY